MPGEVNSGIIGSIAFWGRHSGGDTPRAKSPGALNQNVTIPKVKLNLNHCLFSLVFILQVFFSGVILLSCIRSYSEGGLGICHWNCTAAVTSRIQISA